MTITDPTPSIPAYLIAAPRWAAEMSALRNIALSCGLGEEIKWRKPCFTHRGGNVAILQPMNDDCRLMFFKGVLLADPQGLLTSQGENTQAARVLRVTSTAQITAREPAIRALILAAMAVEESGLTAAFPAKRDLDLPPELIDRLDADPDLSDAWAKLTPGRQRSWVLHIASAKQSATRTSRIDKAAPDIRAGAGWNELRR